MNRQEWTDELLEASVRDITSSLGRFPTASALRDLGRNDVAVQISRRGGFVTWAQRIGAERKQSDSDTGWAGEELLSTLLRAKGFRVERQGGVKQPYDLLVEDVLRLDVKTARFADYGTATGWFYNIAKYVQADAIAFVRSDMSDFYLVPWWDAPKKSVTITRNGRRFDAYHMNADIISSMVSVRAEEIKRLRPAR